MQVYPGVTLSPTFNPPHYSAPYGKPQYELTGDFAAKLEIGGFDEETDPSERRLGAPPQEPQVEEAHEDEDDDDDDDDNFSFACLNPSGSPVNADDVFEHGQIRPVFPLSNRDLLFPDSEPNLSAETSAAVLRPPLKKVFSGERDAAGLDEPRGTSNDWNPTARVLEETSPAPAPAGSCRKSNSTGSSKLWRFRDLLPRSNSDGRDAVVILNPAPNAKASDGRVEKAKKISLEKVVKSAEAAKKKAKGKGKALASAHERHYVKNRSAMESEKRKSYLPYRRDLLGFFTNVNVLSKNVHPF